MPYVPQVLAFAGSTRRESFNQRLLKVAIRGAEEAGARVTELNLADLPLPLFDQDFGREHGLPENAVKLKQLMQSHEGFLIACPEYNSSITPLLKNTIDWASRQAGDPAPLLSYRGKVATLMSASPGALGGLRGLVTVRSILGNIGVIVLPDQLAISKAGEAFADDGSLKDASQHQRILDLGRKHVEFLKRLNG
jgi:NAD(P)H-dependent FMN reductase